MALLNSTHANSYDVVRYVTAKLNYSNYNELNSGY
jgi:hypothetical protein